MTVKKEQVVVTGQYNEPPLRVFLWRFATGQFLSGPKPPIAPTWWERKTRVQRALWRWTTIGTMAGIGAAYEYNHLATEVGLLAFVPYGIHHGTLSILKRMERPEQIRLVHHLPEPPEDDMPTLEIKQDGDVREPSPW